MRFIYHKLSYKPFLFTEVLLLKHSSVCRNTPFVALPFKRYIFFFFQGVYESRYTLEREFASFSYGSEDKEVQCPFYWTELLIHTKERDGELSLILGLL